jgi:hypothetical protein
VWALNIKPTPQVLLYVVGKDSVDFLKREAGGVDLIKDDSDKI